jgi:hypothetical protein
MTHEEKKSERLEVRLGFQEKTDFVDACDTQGDTPSSALRRFISGYIKRSDGDLMGAAQRRLLRRYGFTAAVIGAVGLVAAVFALKGGFAVRSEPSFVESTDMSALKAALDKAEEMPQTGGRLTGQAALDAAKAAGPQPIPEIDHVQFEKLDMDDNGLLMRGEILPSDHHLHRLLDIDGEAGISPSEFYVTGNMHYKLAESWDMKVDGASKRLAHTGTSDTVSVEFNLSQSPPLIHAARPLENAVIARPDRTVIWAVGKTKPFFVFTNDTHALRKP